MRVSRFTAVATGALAAAALALAGAAGAATRPGGGIWLGLPSGALALAVLPACCWSARRRARGRPLAPSAGWGLPALLLLCGVPLAGVHAVSGGPLLALASACGVGWLAAAGWRAPRLLFLPLVFLVLVCAGARSSVRVGPQGDEPHYLMVADSLLRDHDVSLERDYAEARYAVFHDAPLAPHYRVRGRGREIYSLHAVGLSVAILPAWALGGYPAVTVFMALLAALLVRRAARVGGGAHGPRRTLPRRRRWLLALSPPLLHYAGLVFTEVPAALAFSYGLRRGRSLALGTGGALGVGARRRRAAVAQRALRAARGAGGAPRRLAARAAPSAGGARGSGAGIGPRHRALPPGPLRVLGSEPRLRDAPEFSPGHPARRPPGPVPRPGVRASRLRAGARAGDARARARCCGRTAASASSRSQRWPCVVLTAGSWHMWRGGFNPPGRFLVPIVPLLVLAWRSCGTGAG